MTQEKQIDAYLRDIQDCFFGRKITGSDKKLWWGQFLDNTNNMGQVGLYGAVAGVLALKAPSTGPSNSAHSAEQQLIEYWVDRNCREKDENLRQNIRLASLLMGVCFLSTSNIGVISEIAEELQKRAVSSDGLWGDDANATTPDARSLEFSSAIVVIFSCVALHFFRGDPSILDGLRQTTLRAGKSLQQRYLDDQKRHRPYEVALQTAVILTLGKTAHRSIRNSISNYVWARDDVFERYWYHLDYMGGNNNIKRDYFILPTRLLIPFILMRNDLNGTQYLAANSVIGSIKNTLDSSALKLFVEPSGRPSSLEQALVIIALEASRTTKKFTLSLIFPWLWISAKKQRSPELLFSWMLIILFYIPLGIVLGSDIIINAYGNKLWAGTIEFLDAAKLIPAWIPSSLLLVFSAIRKPDELLRSAFGRHNKK